MNETKLIEQIAEGALVMKDAAQRQVEACDRILDIIADWQVNVEKMLNDMKLEEELVMEARRLAYNPS